MEVSPRLAIRFILCLTRVSSNSTPVASALYFLAARMTILPSPDPRSNIFSPGRSSPSCSIRSTIASGVGVKGARLSIPPRCADSRNVKTISHGSAFIAGIMFAVRVYSFADRDRRGTHALALHCARYFCGGRTCPRRGLLGGQGSRPVVRSTNPQDRNGFSLGEGSGRVLQGQRELARCIAGRTCGGGWRAGEQRGGSGSGDLRRYQFRASAGSRSLGGRPSGL